MATKYPDNPLFNEALKTSYALGKTIPRRSPKAVNLSRYSNLYSGARQTQAPANISGNFSNLGSITTPYGGSTRYEKFHPGLDIANKIGTPIGAVTSGIISEVMTGKKQGDPGFGNYVVITDQYGNKVRYSHLAQEYVNVGQPIKKGSTLGLMGNTGKTYSTSGGTGSHLDFRIRDIYNNYINPNKYLQMYG